MIVTAGSELGKKLELEESGFVGLIELENNSLRITPYFANIKALRKVIRNAQKLGYSVILPTATIRDIKPLKIRGFWKCGDVWILRARE